MSIAQNFPNLKPSLLLDFSNTEALDSRVTFTRASEGRFYGTQTAKAEENLFTQSQVFTDTAIWNNTVGATITSSTETAPDGASTATKFVANNGATVSYVGRVVSPGVTNGGATIDLTNGTTAVAFGSFGSLSATAVGNGWYRIVAANSGYVFSFFAKAAEYTFAGIQITDRFRMYACNQSGSTTLSPAGDGTKGILIWGAQLEQRSAVTAYTPTTTQPITNYIPVLESAAAGVARFDHNPTTFESLGLLIEEQRTNLLVRSEQFDDAAWTKARASVTANIIVSPDGTVDADKLVEDTATGTHRAIQSFAFVSGTTYTFSVYAKAAERGFINLLVPSAAFGANIQANFNLTTGAVGTVVGAVTASIQSAGNGWYRCSITVTATASSTQSAFIHIATAATGNSYTGDGYSGIYIWGAQLE